MELYYSPASPYVRKVLIVAHELGISDQIRIKTSTALPTQPEEVLNSVNPLGKIPVLVLDDGECLYDSRVICEYLSGTRGSNEIFPSDGKARWSALKRQALADGLLDAAMLVRYEALLRPDGMQFSPWADAQMAKIERALEAMAAVEAPETSNENKDVMDIGEISFVAALGYLDFRFPNVVWRAAAPGLDQWFAGMADRDSVVATRPA